MEKVFTARHSYLYICALMILQSPIMITCSHRNITKYRQIERCDMRANEWPQTKLHRKGTYRYIYIYTWTSRLLERIGLGAGSLKTESQLHSRLYLLTYSMVLQLNKFKYIQDIQTIKERKNLIKKIYKFTLFALLCNSLHTL